MAWKKGFLGILSAAAVLAAGCAASENITEIAAEQYLAFENAPEAQKSVVFWDGVHILYDTTAGTEEMPRTAYHVQDMASGAVYPVSAGAEAFWMREIRQSNDTDAVYAKQLTERTADAGFGVQIVRLSLETAAETVLQDGADGYLRYDLNRLNDTRLAYIISPTGELGEDVSYTILDTETGAERRIDLSACGVADGTAANAFTTDAAHLYLYIDHPTGQESAPRIHVFDADGAYETAYDVDLDAFLTLQEGEAVPLDAVVGLWKCGPYFLLQTQSSRYALFQEAAGELLPIQVPRSCMESFAWWMAVQAGNEAERLVFYNDADGMLEFRADTGTFTETTFRFPAEKADHAISGAWQDREGTVLFETNDGQKRDPDRSYGYFLW